MGPKGCVRLVVKRRAAQLEMRQTKKRNKRETRRESESLRQRDPPNENAGRLAPLVT